MIQMLLLTGFLGAGKTTLLQKLLFEFKNEKIGVIVNEFGQAGIDGILIEQNGIVMSELNNGSIFCSCIKENFLNSLIALSSSDIQYLFIEASGLADPANMPQILHAIHSKTKVPYDYKGSICVVDAETFLDYYDLLPALHQQVAYSGAVIVNKSDLVDDTLLSDVLEKLNETNPLASIVVTTFCQADIHKLVDDLQVLSLPQEESSNTEENRPKTIVLTSDEILPACSLNNFLNKLKADSYRIKGFAKTSNGIVYISGLKNHIETLPWEGPFYGTKIVVISAVGMRMVSRITNALGEELKDSIKMSL
ncbi:MAG: GTP-binding protein [Clostridia bacterium]|nr:GTP-binding protein [Clostridia bacterium]